MEMLSEEGFLSDIWMRGFCHRTIRYKKTEPELAADILPLHERIGIADVGSYDWAEYYYGLVDACAREFCQRPLEAVKPRKLALTACMRKLLTILDSMVRTGQRWDPIIPKA